MVDKTRRERVSEPDIPEVEGAGSAPTTREHASPLSDLTMLEHQPSPDAGAARFGLAPLPTELANNYRPVRQLPSSGAEATLFEVFEISTGEIRVLKLYHRYVVLRTERLLRIQSIDPAHVVHLVDHGQLTDGRWYEVLERIDAGDLLDYQSRVNLTERDLEEVVAQLAAAVAAFHRAGLAHHDIKPENILVRNVSPLNLVLGDFGLAVVSDNSTYYATNRNATIAYQAPETMRQIGGGARDYWATGLTVAMLATGEAPYSGLNEHAILDQHYNQIPPGIVESMPDGRLKQLCRGLTRYDPKTRWSEHEVRNWLRGDAPTVVADEAPPQPSSTRVVHFNNKRFTIPSALAREILECWSLAAETIGVAARRERFMDELILTFGTEALAKLTRRWSKEPHLRRRIDTAIVELLYTLDPEAPAIYRSRPLDTDTLAAAALGESEEDTRFVQDLLDRGLLSAWSQIAGKAQLGDIDSRWRDEIERAYDIVADASATGVDAPPLEIWTSPLLAVCAKSTLLDDWKRQRSASRVTGELVPDWYKKIADNSQPADVIGAVLLASDARRIQSIDLETRRRQLESARQAERERKRRILRSLTGWAAATTYATAWLLEIVQYNRTSYEPEPGARLLVYAIAFALFRQWRNAAADSRRIRSSPDAEPTADGHFAGDDLSAGRRAEAYGILAFVLTAAWATITNLSPPIIRIVPGGSTDPVTILQDGYKLAGLLSITWSLLAFTQRRNEDPPTADEALQLRAADRRTLTKTGLSTAAIGLVTSWEGPAADVISTIWLPILCGGTYMLVRGRWSHRRAGTTWAIALLTTSAAMLGATLLWILPPSWG